MQNFHLVKTPGKNKLGRYPQQHHTLPESSRNAPGPSLPPVLLRMPPCKAKLRVTAQSRPDRGPTRRCNRAPIVAWCNPSHPYYSSTLVFLSMRIATVSIAKLGDASLVQLTGPSVGPRSGRDGAIGARSGPDGAIRARSGPDGAIGARSGPDGAIGARSGPDGAIGARLGPDGAIGPRSLRGATPATHITAQRWFSLACGLQLYL